MEATHANRLKVNNKANILDRFRRRRLDNPISTPLHPLCTQAAVQTTRVQDALCVITIELRLPINFIQSYLQE